MEKDKFVVLSVGVDPKGNAVVRMMNERTRAIYEIGTNVVGMAKLAAAGASVSNELGRCTNNLAMR